jgi:PIN domain nuclease of toxin-antitoxin system
MRLLLDTHTLLWFLEDNPLLSAKARSAISDPSNQSYYSLVSIWEMSIKISLGKLKTSSPLNPKFEENLNEQGFLQSVPSFEEVAGVQYLPFHHNDPFDRLLISQAMSSNAHHISKDDVFNSYDVKRLW